MRTAWIVNGKYLGEFNSPGTYANSSTRYLCLYCGEVFAQVVSLEDPPEGFTQPWWYCSSGNCGCKKYKPEEASPHVVSRLWQWDLEENPPPRELLAQEFLHQMNQIDWSAYARCS